jgi:hypothetical protein
MKQMALERKQHPLKLYMKPEKTGAKRRVASAIRINEPGR